MGCGSGAGTSADMARSDGGGDGPLPDGAVNAARYRYVSNQITLPTSAMDYAVDYGSGPVNQLGSIVSTLSQQNVNLQAQEDALIKAGDGLNLFSFASADPALIADPGAAVTIYEALTMASPDFTGAGTFSVDATVPKGVLAGPLATGAFSSADPLKLTMPATVYLKIPLYTEFAVSLPVVGARVSFTPTEALLAVGRLNGAIRKKDVDSILVPALAMALDKTAQRMPCDQGCMQVLQLFDVGNGSGGPCSNPDGSTAAAKDGHIGLCEVSGSPLIQILLAPDVQLFDANGNWKPNPKNAMPDSLSLGVAFTAVKATFTE
jgi:hypothetical protein